MGKDSSSNLLFFVLLLLIVCASRISSDIYSPCIPAMAQDLRSNIDMVQFSMSIYMLGVSLSQLIYGPISEGIGRRIPILFGLSVMSAGSIINIYAPSIEAIIFGRLIEGLGAGACSSLWRAIARDHFSGKELAQTMSNLVVFIIFVVPAAPVLGGYLEELIGWRANFIFMASYTFIALILCFFNLEESNKHLDKQKLKPRYIMDNFLYMLKSRTFMQMTLAIFMTYGAFFTWFLVSPALMIKKLGISPSNYGWFNFIGVGGAFFISSLINSRLVSKLGIRAMMRIGWSITTFAGASMLLSYLAFGVCFWALLIPMMMFACGATFVFPNAFAASFAPFGDRAGYAAAIYGSMQIGGAALFGFIISFLPDENQLYMSMIMFSACLSAWLLFETAPKLIKDEL